MHLGDVPSRQHCPVSTERHAICQATKSSTAISNMRVSHISILILNLRKHELGLVFHQELG
eukprot:4475129-Prymnesium_polylepis.2